MRKKKFLGRVGSILPAWIKESMVKLAAMLAPEEFLNYSHVEAEAPHPEASLRALSDYGFEPEFIVDVGAYEGEWTRMVSAIWPHSRVLMVEPNSSKKDLLKGQCQSGRVELVTELLGSTDGQVVEFNVMETGSSVYSEQSDVARIVEKRKLRALDTLVGGRRVDLLKIDTQGYEMQVLKGAEGILQHAEVVLLELSLIEINRGAPLIAEMIAFMNDKGYVLFDIIEFHRRPQDKALWQLDGLFVRADSRFRRDTSFDVKAIAA